MALVNPNIAMSFKPTTEYQPRNALADYAQMQQIQTSDMQMQEYRRKSEGLERIRTAISKAGGPDDLETAAQEMMKVPEYFDQGYGIYQTIKDKKAFEEYLKGKGQPAGTSPVGAPTAARPTPAPGALGSGTFDPTAPVASYRVMGTDTDRPLMDKVYQMGQSTPLDTRQRGFSSTAPTNALTPATAAAPVVAPTNALVDPVEAIQNEIMQLTQFKDPRAQVRVKQLERQLTAMEPTPAFREMKALGFPLTAQGYADYINAKKPEGLLSPEEEAQKIRIANASRISGGGGKAPSGYRFTPFGELEAIPGGPADTKPMTELQQQKANKDRVAEQQGVQAAKSTADELEKLTDELVGNPEKGIPQHPGYSRIVGLESMLPSVKGGNAARAEQKLETFKGKIATLGRQLASQYGKLGNMAVQEWKIVSDSVQNINPGAGNLDQQMRDVVRQARGFEQSMQNKYDALYGDETQQVTAPVKPSTKGSRTVTRTGIHNGKRVVQYSDGSLEYAD
jgi:hypothetical protein